MIVVAGLLVVWAGIAAAGAPSKPRPPAYAISFAGSGSQHHLDDQKNIQDDGTCDSAEHVDVVARLAWAATWTGVRPPGRGSAGRWQAAGSTIAGSDVKDACGLAPEAAPSGWLSQSACNTEPAVIGSPQLGVGRRTAKALILSVSAPRFAVPVAAQCSLNVRNDQFAAHIAVPVARLGALRKGQSLTFVVGTAHPGPGDSDVYAPSLDCSQPTKPYDGYRTADHCQDDLSWSGTLKITRAG